MAPSKHWNRFKKGGIFVPVAPHKQTLQGESSAIKEGAKTTRSSGDFGEVRAGKVTVFRSTRWDVMSWKKCVVFFFLFVFFDCLSFSGGRLPLQPRTQRKLFI